MEIYKSKASIFLSVKIIFNAIDFMHKIFKFNIFSKNKKFFLKKIFYSNVLLNYKLLMKNNLKNVVFSKKKKN